MTGTQASFSHNNFEQAGRIMDTVIVPLYEATHADVTDNPFYNAERFAERVRGYMKAPGFEIVIAEIDGRFVGQAFGYTLPQTARWWQGLTTPVDPDLIAETGRRTFALCELMVHPDWQRHGIARSLHDELFHHRSEERATLLVRDDNTAAQNAYEKWGWTKMATLRPYADAPNYDALILPLRER
jgi:ribosomal protein S18 acetylase RimI-like enzyme